MPWLIKMKPLNVIYQCPFEQNEEWLSACNHKAVDTHFGIQAPETPGTSISSPELSSPTPMLYLSRNPRISAVEGNFVIIYARAGD